MDGWICRKIGLPAGAPLTRAAIEGYQLEMLRRTLLMAKSRSPYYRETLAGVDPGSDVTGLEDLRKIPFTSEADLRANGRLMACVPQSEVSRIVTLDTSGSAGAPKRIFFTEGDQELTIDFFHHGMKNLVDETDTVLIMLPCMAPGSVGDLLRTGLGRGGVNAVPFGPVPRADDSRDAEALAAMRSSGATSIVGGPKEVARLARSSPEAGAAVRTVLLSTEYVSDGDRSDIERLWGCRVFEHYGSTECGLGGAVSCHVRQGYHPREADLIFEIIHLEKGEAAPDGEWGEVVFTTVTREAMPFIRYRTGDVSRWIPGPCGCGSVLRRLDRVRERAAVKNRR
jgi:phenylacetate-coenzyme A ligase PaaK-like adenylate-forming protein